ncbi:hypothetical protein HKX48_007215 [Thoreauomyces humboldtii]|nr:hypothetical protein HKX48_007215 [Thoreauomyces humboldtii]
MAGVATMIATGSTVRDKEDLDSLSSGIVNNMNSNLLPCQVLRSNTDTKGTMGPKKSGKGKERAADDEGEAEELEDTLDKLPTQKDVRAAVQTVKRMMKVYGLSENEARSVLQQWEKLTRKLQELNETRGGLDRGWIRDLLHQTHRMAPEAVIRAWTRHEYLQRTQLATLDVLASQERRDQLAFQEPREERAAHANKAALKRAAHRHTH